MRLWHAFLTVVVAACSGPSHPAESDTHEAPPRAPAPERPPEPALEPTPTPPEPSLCETDADCSFDSTCVPTRCVVGEAREEPCEESAPPPGTCHCLAGRCALRPNAEHREIAADAECDYDEPSMRCGLDAAAGQCIPGKVPDDVGAGRFAGPRCYCDPRTPRRCHLYWVDEVPCESDRDCWVELDPVPHPIRRPARLRGRAFRPCRDGEKVPVCAGGACSLRVAGC